MVTCRVCGTCSAAMLPIRGEVARQLRLLEKLFHATRLQLNWDGNVCFRCVYKIDEFSEWLHSVEENNDEYKNNRGMVDRGKGRAKNIHKTKKIKETYVEENVWKEHFTFNLTNSDGETNEESSDEIIPNAQKYTSMPVPPHNSYLKPEAGQNTKTMNEFTYRNPDVNADVNTLTSPQFSFLPAAATTFGPKSDGPGKVKTENLHKQKKFSANGPKVNIPKNHINGDAEITFSFLTQKNKEEPNKSNKRRFDYNEWNLQSTYKNKLTEQLKQVEEKNVYKKMNNAHRKENLTYKQGCSNNLALKGQVAESNTSARGHFLNRKRTSKVYDSVDLFASQSEECNHSKEMGSMDWQLAPDEDLIERVREKLNNKHDFY